MITGHITQNQTPENPNAIGICYHSVITLQNHHCHICYITLKSSFDKIFIIHCISLKFHCQIIRPSAAAAAAKSLQSCLTLWDPIDSSPPGSPIPGILQARTLEWVAISFSNAWKWIVKVKSLSHAQLLVTPWTAAHQAPPSMGFSRPEYWSGVPLPSLPWEISRA